MVLWVSWLLLVLGVPLFVHLWRFLGGVQWWRRFGMTMPFGDWQIVALVLYGAALIASLAIVDGGAHPVPFWLTVAVLGVVLPVLAGVAAIKIYILHPENRRRRYQNPYLLPYEQRARGWRRLRWQLDVGLTRFGPELREWHALLPSFRRMWSPWGYRLAPARWALANRREYEGFRKLGVPGFGGARYLSQWFTVDQARRLGWPGRYLLWIAGGDQRPPAARVYYGDWDADAFIRTVHASTRGMTEFYEIGWPKLQRLGSDDQTEFLRYAASTSARLPLGLAFRLSAGLPYDVFAPMYQHLRAAWDAQDQRGRFHNNFDTFIRTVIPGIIDEFTRNPAGYSRGWEELSLWVAHDRAEMVNWFQDGRFYQPGGEMHFFDRWREWSGVARRAPEPHPSLWLAAGFTPAEAMSLLDEGRQPDAATLASLAALRKGA